MTETFSLADDVEAGFAAAATAVAEGLCVVLPTDTVYGIGADAFSADAVQRLLDAKRRDRDMPPPVLIAERLMMRAVVSAVPEAADALAKAFWPGALTLIRKAQPAARLQLGNTHGTVAVRVPDDDRTRALLRRTGPLAVSSANVSGEPAATSCAEAAAQLGDAVAVYLDGGRAPGGVASTIVDFTRFEHGEILRPGALSLEQIRAVVPDVVAPEPETPEPPADEDQVPPVEEAAIPPADEAAAPPADEEREDTSA